MIARSLTVLSGAMLLLAIDSYWPVQAQEPPAAASPAQPAPAGARTQKQEREAAEPAVTEPAMTEPAVTETTATEPAAEPRSASPPAEGAAAEQLAPQRNPAAAGTKFRTMDRIELDSTAITGNRELPKVLYIVPWKKADLGDLVGRPANSLLDEVLTPVDRDVFRRQTEYFSKLDAAPAGSAAEPEQKPAPAPR